MNKIFCIGANKTGTTSLKRQLIKYGLKTPLQIKHELLNKNISKGDFKALFELIIKFDFFQDSPFSHGLIFAQLDSYFPNSKFILTIRDNESWFDSLTKFHAKIFKKKSYKEIKISDLKKAKYVYEGYFYDSFKRNWLYDLNDGQIIYRNDLLYDKNHFIEKYNTRNKIIMNYFKERDNLLIIDITKEKSDQN